MLDDIVIAKIRKSAVTEVWVVVKTYAGKRLCDVREHFCPANGPGWLPTKKGIAFPVDMLSKAIDAVEELARRTTVCEVADIQRGEKARICFAIREFQHHIYGEIRTYYKDLPNGNWKPGKGVTLPLSMLNNLVEALRFAEDQI